MDFQGWVPSVVDREDGEGAQPASQQPALGTSDQETTDEGGRGFEAESRYVRPWLRSRGFGSQLLHGNLEIWCCPPRWFMYITLDSPWMKSRNYAGSLS